MKQKFFFAFVLALVVFSFACSGGGGRRRRAGGLGPEIPEDWFKIYTADDLIELADQVNSGNTAEFPNNGNTVVRLMNDIDLAGKPFSGIAVGNDRLVFNATFDGGGFLIENMNINTPGNDYAGFIGKTSPTAVVRNLRFKNASVIGSNYVGIVAGDNQGIIERCGTGGGTAEATDNVGRVEGRGYVGGIAGNNNNWGKIRECYNTATVVSENGKIGGIVGFNVSNGLVINAYNLGKIETSATIPQGKFVGGIAGVNAALSSQQSFGVLKCYSLKGTEFAPLIGNLAGTGSGTGNSSPDFLSPQDLDEATNRVTLEQKYHWDFIGVWEMRSEGKVSLRHVK